MLFRIVLIQFRSTSTKHGTMQRRKKQKITQEMSRKKITEIRMFGAIKCAKLFFNDVTE